MLKRPETENSVRKAVNDMNNAFSEADIQNFEHLIPTLNLPDPDDRHVLAAAIHAKADCIVTFNLKDFPSECMQQFDIEVIHPDDFIVHFIKTQPEKCLKAFRYQVDRLKSPPMTASEVLVSLEKCGLVESMRLLRKFLGLIA